MASSCHILCVCQPWCRVCAWQHQQKGGFGSKVLWRGRTVVSETEEGGRPSVVGRALRRGRLVKLWEGLRAQPSLQPGLHRQRFSTAHNPPLDTTPQPPALSSPPPPPRYLSMDEAAAQRDLGVDLQRDAVTCEVGRGAALPTLPLPACRAKPARSGGSVLVATAAPRRRPPPPPGPPRPPAVRRWRTRCAARPALLAGEGWWGRAHGRRGRLSLPIDPLPCDLAQVPLGGVLFLNNIVPHRWGRCRLHAFFTSQDQQRRTPLCGMQLCGNGTRGAWLAACTAQPHLLNIAR